MLSIKGLRQGLLIVFSDKESEPWVSRLRELENKLNANPGFFRGGQMALDVKSLSLSRDDLQRTLDLLRDHDVKLLAVLSENEMTNAHAISLDVPVALPVAKPNPSEKPKATEPQTDANATKPTEKVSVQENEEGTDGLLVKRRVRSGQVLRHPGHIVVVGDVNPGAQIIAGGDIIVWGRMHGSAHAGALGNVESVVCALELSPSLIKIADAAARDHKGASEMAQIKDQVIVFMKWG
jgi:septum site-determining protein MinC